MAAPMRICFQCRRYWVNSARQLHSSNRLELEENTRVRFAPSPTGLLHLGGLRTALYNYLFAKSNGGTFILRIEDTDQSRVVPGALEKLESMLQWTGVVPDEGPFQGGQFGPYVQSERLELYQESAKALVQNGSAYYCFCSPKRLELLRKNAVRCGETPRYDNRCRHISDSEVKDKLACKTPYVIRLKLEDTDEPWEDLIKGPITHNVADIEGDPILMKSDGFPTYHLANVVDDHYMQVSHVLRGDEWQPSTPKHILLYKAFGWKAPLFAHLPLIVNNRTKFRLEYVTRHDARLDKLFLERANLAHLKRMVTAGDTKPLLSTLQSLLQNMHTDRDGTKLSKRQGDIHVEHFKEQGYLAAAVLSFVTRIGGGFHCDTSSLTLQQLIQQFRLEYVTRHDARLDKLFLERANLAHLKRMVTAGDTKPLLSTLQSLLQNMHTDRAAEGDQKMKLLDDDYLLHVLQWAMREDRMHKLSDLLLPEFAFLWQTPDTDEVKSLQMQHNNLGDLLTGCLQHLNTQVTFNKESLAEVLKNHAQSSDVKISVYMQLMRRVLSGLKTGPPVAEMMTVIGRDNTIRRLQHSVKLLQSCTSILK